MTSPSNLLRPCDVAERLSISKVYVYKLTAAEAIPCVRIGKAIRYRPDDIESYVAECYRERKTA